jgi:hypothetical protein
MNETGNIPVLVPFRSVGALEVHGWGQDVLDIENILGGWGWSAQRAKETHLHQTQRQSRLLRNPFCGTPIKKNQIRFFWFGASVQPQSDLPHVLSLPSSNSTTASISITAVTITVTTISAVAAAAAAAAAAVAAKRKKTCHNRNYGMMPYSYNNNNNNPSLPHRRQ